MKLKHILLSLVYLISVVLMVSPRFIGIFARGGAAAILGTAALAALTGVYGTYIYQAAKPRLTVTTDPGLPDKETPYEKYRKLTTWFAAYHTYGRNVIYDSRETAALVNAEMAELRRQGSRENDPFHSGRLGTRINDSVVNISVKYEQTVKVLSESFNPADITYQNYISVLDNVLDLAGAHAKSIKKRLCVFDYRTWTSDPLDTMCQQYVDEVEQSVVQLEEIGGKFDHLLHELVNLDEISETPLQDMQTLIETTSDYRSIEE
ncbi:hypothetical protein [Ruminococcus sp.]|uniref:hypothetical protein n=1 Tax=Ruminococcus sp. TaxID=41978 RepID=UPI0025E6B1D2|nr:hypothetical protein [Ruminococcus sp.]MBQ8966030.1 hypothetical protein [Ruminococcus sp.]